MSSRGKILFIDAYDSFSNNIVTLLRQELSVAVELIKVDDQRFVLNDDAFFNYLNGFHAVVAGPGPGHPANPKDVGLIAKLWMLSEAHLLPVLGICLGFQSLALHYGARVERLTNPRHGMVTPVLHCQTDIFADTAEILATQYHSLHASPSKPEAAKELIPLAVDTSDATNGPILMAARHCHRPYWGVQYHPESICTNDEGRKLIRNWWSEVKAWRAGRSTPMVRLDKTLQCKVADKAPSPKPESSALAVQWSYFDLPCDVEVTDLVDTLRTSSRTDTDPILLESGMRNGKPVNAETGRFSIIGLHDDKSTQIRYDTNSQQLEVRIGNKPVWKQPGDIAEVFTFLEMFMREHKAIGGPAEIPFWGGLVGYISYEAGLETIDVLPSTSEQDRPDVWYVFIERSVVVDHVNGTVYVQSIRSNDQRWMSPLCEQLRRLPSTPTPPQIEFSDSQTGQVVVSPRADRYRQEVRQCQDHLRAGSSYELCLTDTTEISIDAEAWHLYQRLRAINPAPFSAYMHLPGLDIISSSPERFLSWSREGRCQFRPIKGTVKKTPDMTRARAETILSSPKERAENLMIVDLIRHDLSGVDGVRNVRVPKLMTVEEYETVYQLVSIIEGDVQDNTSRNVGVDVLAASLPPGSMTGAPKKRSCELLKSIENDRPRELYSGVMGYLDVGGGGDFSVVIRTAFKWAGENWRVGAGGAVTALSEPEAEWQEMLAKRQSLLRAFGVADSDD